MNASEVKVWDPLVRIFHWSLATSFAVAYFSAELSEGLHTYAGYTIVGLLAVRTLWGFIGSRHARFSDFVRPPGEVFAYLREMATLHPPRHLGHNPAGGTMIVVLLLSLLFTASSGMALYGIDGDGPLGPLLWTLGGTAEDILEEVHEFFANFTVLLVVVHIAGVVVGSVLHHENLVRAMVTGRKRTDL